MAELLTREQIEKIALLARLWLSSEELEVLTPQLQQIVHFVEQLEGLDTEGVEPMAHAVELANVLAEDRLEPGLTREQALAAAPKRDDECFLVPPVLGD